jgi:hypothetical protein
MRCVSSRCAHLALGLSLVASLSCKRTESAAATPRDAGPTVAAASPRAETETNLRAALASEGCSITREEPGVYYVRCGASGVERPLELATFDALVRELASAEERRAQAKSYVHRFTSDTKLPEAPPLEKLRLAIRKQSYIAARAAGMSPGAAPIILSPLGLPGTLVVLVAVDTPDNIVFLDKSTLASWKLDEASVSSKALDNLDAHPIPPKRLGPDDTAVYGLESLDDDYEASRLLSPSARQSLEKAVGGRALFAIPDQQHLLAARADDARAVAALRALATAHSAGPLGLTDATFEVDSAGKLRALP